MSVLMIKQGTMTLDMSYSANTGGITTKSDVGTLVYGNSDKPYTVSSINPGTGLIDSASQTITYKSFNKISTISENGYTASFIYGSDNERDKMVVQQNSSTILTRWYPTESYIKETAAGATKEYTFIGGNSYSAHVVAITQSGTTTYYNILRDYLGNITHVVNASDNSVVAEYSYDAWGRMRNPSTWENYAPGSEPALFIAGRGFTGHVRETQFLIAPVNQKLFVERIPTLQSVGKHLPWFNLINLKGRVYDALTGRFLSPDNYVQAPDNTQNFNRYSYCLNNPLKFTDPSGFIAAPADMYWNLGA